MIHSKKYVIDTGYVDRNRKLRLSNLFWMFQEIAEEHAEELGIGQEKVTLNKRKWIITRHSVVINRLPEFPEKVTLYTYPGKNNPFFLYRHFYLEDEKGNLLLRGCSIWAILDAATNKIIVNPFGHPLPEDSKEDELPIPSKIEEDALNKVKEHVVEYGDIDLNGHLNNTKYIDLIQNIHSSDFYKEHEFAAIDVNYFLEIKENEVVDLYSDIDGKKEIIKGTVGGKDCFKAKIIYK